MVDAGRPDHHAMPHRHPPIPPRQILAQVIVGAVILVSGIAIGSGGTILALKDRIIPTTRSQTGAVRVPARDPNEIKKRADWIADQWEKDYGLSEEQTRRARELLSKEFTTTEKLREDTRKVEQAQREKFVLAVKAILTAEQFTRWEADFRRMVEHMQRFDPRRGGRGGPPGERRPDWRPDRPMDPNERREGWQPRDPNGPRGDWPRGGFRGPESRRGDRPPRDPNGRRGERPPERFMGPEGQPEGPPPLPPAESNGVR